MDVLFEGGAEFGDGAFEIVRRFCSESFGAEVANTNFCVTGHSVVCATKILEGNTGKSVRRKPYASGGDSRKVSIS
jgi:hypothetical protein